MSFAYKKGPRFYAGWMDEYRRQRREPLPDKIKTLSEARRMAEELEHGAWRVREGISKKRSPDMTVDEAIKVYLDSIPESYSSKRDLAGRLHNHISKYLGKKYVREVTAVDVMQMLNSAGRVPKRKWGPRA